MAGAALLPRHGVFTSEPIEEFKKKAEEQSDVELTRSKDSPVTSVI